MKEFFGKYILLDRIAVGGMAEVFRAKLTGQKGFEKLIVVKKMLPHLAEDPEMVSHFIDEAKLAALLQHENIIHVYDFGETEGAYFIAMEYLFGKDLKSIFAKSMQTGTPIGVETALLIASKICEGLEYAHNLKNLQGDTLDIIHRDISPQNIFVTYDGKVKIIDFGIAKTTTQTSKTQVGIIKGKVAYMSPEQAEGKPIDRRSDVFAAGILLYEMVTGKEMYSGDTMEVLNKAMQAQFEPPEKVVPDLPARLYAILNRALEKDVDRRYQSCREMMADIEDCLYDMDCRPSTKRLEDFIAKLFEKEFAREKRDAIDIVQHAGAEGQEATGTVVADTDYQKTRVIDREDDAGLIGFKKDVVEYSKKLASGNKRWVLLISTLVMLVILGVILVKNREAKHAEKPAAGVELIKRIPKIIVDDIRNDLRHGKSSPAPEREHAK